MFLFAVFSANICTNILTKPNSDKLKLKVEYHSPLFISRNGASIYAIIRSEVKLNSSNEILLGNEMKVFFFVNTRQAPIV